MKVEQVRLFNGGGPVPNRFSNHEGQEARGGGIGCRGSNAATGRHAGHQRGVCSDGVQLFGQVGSVEAGRMLLGDHDISRFGFEAVKPVTEWIATIEAAQHPDLAIPDAAVRSARLILDPGPDDRNTCRSRRCHKAADDLCNLGAVQVEWRSILEVSPTHVDDEEHRVGPELRRSAEANLLIVLNRLGIHGSTVLEPGPAGPLTVVSQFRFGGTTLVGMADLLRSRPDGPARLRQLLAEPGPLLLPGCYDALGARLIEQAEFDAVYMTGFGTSASLLGRPDVGLLGMSEMVDNARRIVAATDLPVVADADTGYGNQINVVRTVQAYEQAGVAGIHLEDQVLPKRCGHMEGKIVIPEGEFTAKIEAAVETRSNPDFVLIARTDARAPHGLDAALSRARAAHEAGADVLFVEALVDESELELVAKELSGIPLLFNWAEGGKTPPLTLPEITDLGFAMVIMPISTLLAATKAMQAVLAQIKIDGTPATAVSDLPAFSTLTDTIGLPEITDLEQRFAG